jgi:hypothetical protein
MGSGDVSSSSDDCKIWKRNYFVLSLQPKQLFHLTGVELLSVIETGQKNCAYV